MHDAAAIRRVLELVESGVNDSEAARHSGIPRSTVHRWRIGQVPRARAADRCRRCGHLEHRFPELPADYVYLLGIYLGDGHITRHARDVYRLTVSLDARYRGIVNETSAAIASVLPSNRVLVQDNVRGARLSLVSAYSRQWPCLLPQHGPGVKHNRRIALEDWQEALVGRHTGLFIRGLIHSDGCRSTNAVHVGGKRYAYPRYQFKNASADIRRMFCDACDAMGVEWRRMNSRTISVAKRSSVALLDHFVGPKY
jgi:hypothetical protein